MNRPSLSRRSSFISVSVILFTVLVLFASSEAEPEYLNLIENRASSYRILTASSAPESVIEAARELQRLLEKSTGAHLPISHSVEEGTSYISVGKTPLTSTIHLEGLAHDAFFIRVRRPHLLLIGKDDGLSSEGGAGEIDSSDVFQFYNLRRWHRSLSAGSYNAVIEFARRYLGARWYMPGPLGEEVPQATGLRLPMNLDLQVAPRFAMRRFDFTDYDRRSVWAAAAGDSSAADLDLIQLSAEWGRRLRHTNNIVLGNGHGWRQWIPADHISSPWIADVIDMPVYGESNPEYFALVDGQRRNAYTSAAQHGGQLCVANPDVIATYADNIMAYASKQPGGRMFSLAQNDGGRHCECDLCQAWDPPGAGLRLGDVESPFLTDRMLRFQNNVIERVLEKVPDARFTAAAYHVTGRAPLEQVAHPSLHVLGFYNYLPYRYYIPAKRRELEEALAGWEQSSSNYYLSSFYFAYGNYSLPWSSTATLGWMIELMDRHGNQGLSMELGGGGSRPPIGQLGPDVWLTSQLLWDPSQSAESLENEWYLGTFGPKAGPLVRADFDTIAAAMAEEVGRFPDFWRSRGFTQRQINLNVYPSIRQECRDLIARAEAAVSRAPERYRWRVDQIARNWRYVELTLDALDAVYQSRISGTDESIDAALEAGRKREAFLADPANLLAVSPEAVSLSNADTPLDILVELPSGELPTLTVYPTEGPAPLVDGKPQDPAWDAAAVIRALRDNQTLEPPEVDTEVRLLQTERGIFVRVRCEEPDLSNQVVFDTQIWRGDVVEVFLAPSGGSGGYYQFLVNPNSKSWAVAYRGDTGIDRSYKPAWNRQAFREENGWGVELFVPWESLDVARPPGPGEMWRAAFYRNRHTGVKSSMAWAPTKGRFAQPHLFGRLVFGKE